MCGRFTLGISLEELMLRYMLEEIPDYIDYRPHYNIAPTQQIMAVIHDGSQRRAGTLRWGLVPHWAKDLSIGSRMINARSETVLDKPAFRESFLRKRCLIPADGFYEWLKEEDGTKTPYRIIPRTGLFSFAGLYDTWMDPEGQRVSTCTILTTSPNTLMSRIHDRMPVILSWQGTAVAGSHRAAARRTPSASTSLSGGRDGGLSRITCRESGRE